VIIMEYIKLKGKIYEQPNNEVKLEDIDFHIGQCEAELTRLKGERVKMNVAYQKV